MSLYYRHSVNMHNEIFEDLKKWVVEGEIKSLQHQEFIYSYYWLLQYLWNHGKYSNGKFSQSAIKSMLRYNQNDKRLDYIMKKNGLLDRKGYTVSSSDYPVSVKDGEKMKLKMLRCLDDEERKAVHQFNSSNFIVKKPLEYLNKGNKNSSIHVVEGSVFYECMNDRELKCAGFYMYGLLKSGLINGGMITNDCLAKTTGWSVRRVIRVKHRLVEAGLINGLLSARAAKGERKIYKYLTKKKVRFAPEHTFDDLKGIGDSYLRYDFAVFHENLDIAFLIEYDESHHHKGIIVKDVEEDWDGDYFRKVALHDKKKTVYCRDNNIFLVRIPEWEYDNIESILDTVIGNVMS